MISIVSGNDYNRELCMKLSRKLKKILRNLKMVLSSLRDPFKKSKRRSNGAAFKLLPGCPQGRGNVNILVFPQAERGHGELTQRRIHCERNEEKERR